MGIVHLYIYSSVNGHLGCFHLLCTFVYEFLLKYFFQFFRVCTKEWNC